MFAFSYTPCSGLMWYQCTPNVCSPCVSLFQLRPPALLTSFPAALSALMLSVGDWPSPSAGTVAVLEPVLGRELTALVRRAAGGPALPPGRPMDAVHLLWATRRDGLLTGRIMHYLELRSITAAVSADSGEPNPQRPEQAALFTRCRRFCAAIGAPPPPEEDPEAAARRQRLDRLTRLMNADQYQAFTTVRSTSSQRHRSCRLWAESRWPEGVPLAGPAGWHVLLFVIKELVALLVDVCMLVRADGGPKPAGLPAESLTPAHAREAVRRLQVAAPPRADMLLVR